MTWVDLSIFALIFLSGTLGFSHGFVKAVLSLIAWLFSLGIALSFIDELTHFFVNLIPFSDLRVGLSLILLFITPFIIITWMNYLIINSLGTYPFSGLERTLGMFFGLLRGGLITLLLILLSGLTHLPSEAEWWKESFFIQTFKPIVWILHHQLPDEVAKQFNFDSTPHPKKSTTL